jgi:hypothetical protein
MEHVIEPYEYWWNRWGKYCLISSPEYDRVVADFRIWCWRGRKALPDTPPSSLFDKMIRKLGPAEQYTDYLEQRK